MGKINMPVVDTLHNTKDYLVVIDIQIQCETMT